MATAKKKAKPAKDGQTAIFDKEIKDATLEALCRDYFANADPRTKAQRKEHARAKAGVAAAIEGMKGLKDGDVVRVGEYLIPIVARAGGGFEVPEWSKKMAREIRRA